MLKNKKIINTEISNAGIIRFRICELDQSLMQMIVCFGVFLFEKVE